LEPRPEPLMRKILIATLLLAAAAVPSAAAPGFDTPRNATPLTRFVVDNMYGNYGYGFGFGTGYNYIPACPTGYHYDCWHDPYGYRHCGCLPNRW
jgi:uncharacterized membrane protein YedE/YeeE